MTAKKWKLITGTFITLPISILILLACADGGYWKEKDNSILSSQYFLRESLSPFFRNPEYNYLEDPETHNNRFDSIMMEEWGAYFDKKVEPKQIGNLLLESNENEINLLYNNLKDNKSITKHQWLLKIDANTRLEFLKYLANAKHAEVYAKADQKASWDYNNNKSRFIAQPAFEKQLRSLLDKTQSSFIKQRYLFQLVRYLYFDKKNAAELFEQYKNSFPKSAMYYRTLAYLAGSLKQDNKIALSNYYYSLVFENCEPLKVIAHYGFRPQEENDWNTTLGLCKTNEEKLTLWAMLGIIYHDPIRSINEIYKLNPKSEYIDLMSIRYMQTVEGYAESPLLFGSHKPKDIEYGSDFKLTDNNAETIYKLAREGQTNQPFLMNCLAAYLSMIRCEYDKTPEFIQKAKLKLSLKRVDKSLVRLLEFIHKLSIMKSIGSSEESFILSEFKWLRNEKHDQEFYYDLPFSQARNYIAKKYRAQNDLLKAECFQTSHSFYNKESNLEAMQIFLAKTTKTDYEKLLDTFYSYSLENLYEHQAIYNALKDDLLKAKNLFNKSYSKNLQGNPFNNFIKDCNDCDHSTYKGNPYNVIMALDKMIAIKDKLSKNEDVYINALLLGNAFYNITHYGSARAFSESDIMGYYYNGWAIDSSYRDILLNMTPAKKYYNLALKNAATDEQKAKCYFMLAKCERNDWYKENFYADSEYSSYKNNLPDFKIWPSFNELKKYIDTKYAKEVIKECGYFRTYIQSRK